MTHSEAEGGLDRRPKLLWVPHISVYIGENSMSTPWGHKQAKRDR